MLTHIMASFTDLTEARAVLAGGVAHDFNNLLLEFLAKPYTQQALATKVRQVLDEVPG